MLEKIIRKAKIKATCKIQEIIPDHIELYLILDYLYNKKGMNTPEAFKTPIKEMAGNLPIVDSKVLDQQTNILFEAACEYGCSMEMLNQAQRLFRDKGYRGIHFERYEKKILPEANRLKIWEALINC